MTFPVSVEQFESDPPTVTVALDQLPRTECDRASLFLTPERAEALAAVLTSKAADARAGRIDIAYTEDDDA